MEPYNPRSSHVPARTSKAHRSPTEASAATAILFSTVVEAPRSGAPMASPGIKARRLVADQKYFGLEAGLFRTGAGRALARLSGQPPERARIDTHSLGHDFHLDSAASAALLSELLAGGMLYPDGMGRYRPTRLFREYALASVVAPLQRERAKALVDRACALSATINSDWDQVPFRIAMMAVSGSYMTRRDQLSELSLSLAFCRRPEPPAPRPGPSLSRDDGLRQVVDAMRALSSFIVVRVVVDRKAVQRPFGVVFEVGENVADSSVAGWDRFRDWSASVTRWLAVK